MKGGQVVERGAYEELLLKEGVFFELINKQK
jgi:ABC-type multidrug transport system fused ATPase/permease subunit